MHKSEEMLSKAFHSGCRGYILKENAFEELATAIRTVMKDEIYVSNALTPMMLSGFLATEKEPGELSGREHEILKLLAEGYSNREISGLYNASTAVAVVLCLLISLPVDYKLLQVVYQIMMQKFAGWLTFYVKPSLFPEMFLIGIVIYAIISLALNRRYAKSRWTKRSNAMNNE